MAEWMDGRTDPAWRRVACPRQKTNCEVSLRPSLSAGTTNRQTNLHTDRLV